MADKLEQHGLYKLPKEIMQAKLAQMGITEAELGKAIATRKIRLVSTTETTSGLLRTLAGLVTNGRDLTALSADLNSLDQVDLDLARTASSADTLDWDKLLIVLVGDRDAVLPQLEEFGFAKPELLE